jgi:NAD(P)-dependent dehydrogenase (short-subunit alcohol dehydrogenase family)
MDRHLAGRVVLVTGAASGIGAATVRLLAAQGAVTYSADLAAADAGSADSADLRANHIRLDVRGESEWETAIASILERAGRLDALVHSAGIAAASPIADTTLAEWRQVLSTNLDGTFLAIKHGIRAMKEAGGAIVVIGSASGIRPSAGAAAYSTSKAAVSMLVRAAAKECREAEIPIRINAISPGGVKTPLWRAMPFFADLVALHGSEEAAFEAMEAHGGDRFASPEQIADGIVFLVSDAASHITGAELPIDDGYTL